MTTPEKPSRRKDGAERQAKSRQGVARRLDVIEQRVAELPEIRERLEALVALLGVELRRYPGEHRR